MKSLTISLLFPSPHHFHTQLHCFPDPISGVQLGISKDGRMVQQIKAVCSCTSYFRNYTCLASSTFSFCCIGRIHAWKAL
ncbi:hypothetical protein M0R45_007786 [Rubus argutus]|uniref:Uncharacterized protein n=1 Tax=Rubus argutus TaxID=59490 RepID=A0AAW1XZR0_RUBAR